MTQVHLPYMWLESWDKNDFIESKLKQITKLNFQLTQYWMMKLRKKINKKKLKSTELTDQTCSRSSETKIKLE
jgi:hypothetical protein